MTLSELYSVKGELSILDSLDEKINYIQENLMMYGGSTTLSDLVKKLELNRNNVAQKLHNMCYEVQPSRMA